MYLYCVYSIGPNPLDNSVMDVPSSSDDAIDSPNDTDLKTSLMGSIVDTDASDRNIVDISSNSDNVITSPMGNSFYETALRDFSYAGMVLFDKYIEDISSDSINGINSPMNGGSSEIVTSCDFNVDINPLNSDVVDIPYDSGNIINFSMTEKFETKPFSGTVDLPSHSYYSYSILLDNACNELDQSINTTNIFNQFNEIRDRTMRENIN